MSRPCPCPRPAAPGRSALRLLGAAALVLATMTLGLGLAGGATPAAEARTLKLGSRGAAVADLQRELGLRADGHYGRKTRRAVRRFQRRERLAVDGVAGPATLAALGLAERDRGAPPADAEGVLERIAECESGGDPTAVSASGRYRGKYQFSRATWRSVGGSGDPADAPEAEQDRRAAMLYERAGTAPWPHCGRG